MQVCAVNLCGWSLNKPETVVNVVQNVGCLGPRDPEKVKAHLVANTQPVQVSSSKSNTITGVRNRDNIQINPEIIFRFKHLRWRDFNRSQQIPTSVAIDQITLSTRELQKFNLRLGADKPKFPAAFNGPDTDGLARKIPRKNAQIVGSGAMSAKHAFAFAIKLVGVGESG
jgi:hypothetical protein